MILALIEKYCLHGEFLLSRTTFTKNCSSKNKKGTVIPSGGGGRHAYEQKRALHIITYCYNLSFNAGSHTCANYKIMACPTKCILIFDTLELPWTLILSC